MIYFIHKWCLAEQGKGEERNGIIEAGICKPAGEYTGSSPTYGLDASDDGGAGV